jgi:hypothetical protein
VSLYLRSTSWYHDFLYPGTRHRRCIGPVSKTTAKSIMAKKKAEAVEGRYGLPVKKPSPPVLRDGDGVPGLLPSEPTPEVPAPR